MQLGGGKAPQKLRLCAAFDVWGLIGHKACRRQAISVGAKRRFVSKVNANGVRECLNPR